MKTSQFYIFLSTNLPMSVTMSRQRVQVSSFLLLADAPPQRPYRKDRLPRDFYCCHQLAKFRIVRGFIRLFNTQVWLVCYKPTGQCFPGCGEWGTVDLDSKYKILSGETRAHVVHFMKKKIQNKNLHNYSKISTPYNIRLTMLGWRG